MKTRIFTLLIAVGLLVSSCDDFLDVNSDPNNPEEVSPDLALPVGLNYTSTYVGGDRDLNHLGSMMMFSYGEAYGFDWYASEFNYLLTGDFYNEMFEYPYRTALKQYHVLTQQSEEYGYYKAIGNIMKAYHFQILVDLYGKIPYEEALQRAENATPEYTAPDVVYDSLVVKLTKAVETIDKTKAMDNPEGVSGDAVFDGNMQKWGAFANSIKLRLLTRESDEKDKSYINDQISKIQSNGYGYITDNISVNPGYQEGEENKQNPYWSDFAVDFEGKVINTYKATSATQFVIDFFQGTSDPRLGYIFEETTENGFNGINQGVKKPGSTKDQTLPEGVSNLNLPKETTAGTDVVEIVGDNANPSLNRGEGILRGPTKPTIIMTKAEVQFNLAELANKGLNVTGSAKGHYETGIEASFQYLGLDASDAQDYYTQGTENVDWSASGDKEDAIMTQKWLGLFALNMEQVWFDYNRTGKPTADPVGSGSADAAPTGFPISKEAGSHDDRPVRLLYPDSEASRNASNVPKNSDIDPFADKIFWAK